MNSICASVDYSTIGRINAPQNVRVPDLNDDLQRIADENNVSVSASIAFIRTISIDIVQEYRQRLVQQPTFRDKWITLPVIFPSASDAVKTFRVLASIFGNVIAGELSPRETGPNDEEFDAMSSTEPHIYDYVDFNEQFESITLTELPVHEDVEVNEQLDSIPSTEPPVHEDVDVKPKPKKTKVSLRVKLIGTGFVAFFIVATVTVVLLIKILPSTSNNTMTKTAVITIPNTTTITTIQTTTTSTTTTIQTATITTTTTPITTTTTTIPSVMTDCYDWLHINKSTSNGIYQIDPGYGLEPFDVYCDMTTDGGGWTVIQRQVNDSSEMWNNTWQQYKDGFNNGIDRNLWLGNDRIHVMSSRWNVTLRVEINGDRMPNNTNPNIYLYGTYNFSISDEMNDYTLQLSQPIEGNASDANDIFGFHWNNKMTFSTIDKASNEHGIECANGYQFGGWWIYNCVGITLNGKYNPSNESYCGFRWLSPDNDVILPIRSEMKIRRI